LIFSFSGIIIFSIHQPRYSIFKLFDTVFLLSQGHTIYFGPSTQLVPYFASQGFICEQYDNPADFVLDILIASHGDSFTTLCNAYLQSNNAALVTDNRKKNHFSQLKTSARSQWKEFYYLSQRTIRNAIRNPELAASQIGVALMIAILIGLIYNQMKATVDAGVRNRLGAVFFIVVSQIFSTQTALEPFLKERVLFIHVNIS
jgi:ATP-binding cassette subfamily G (WHITE) protein 2